MDNFVFLPHTADIKFQAFGKSLEEAFLNSALALKEVMYKKLKVKGKIKKKICVKGKDKESLLYDFLEEFLFLLDSENFILSSINNLKISERAGSYILTCEATGNDANNYNFTNNVKAITYNEMKIWIEKNKYACQIVVDV